VGNYCNRLKLLYNRVTGGINELIDKRGVTSTFIALPSTFLDKY
jgi:hypothetical protein